MSTASALLRRGLAVLLSQHGQAADRGQWHFGDTAFDGVLGSQLAAEEMFRLGDREGDTDRLSVLDPVDVAPFAGDLPHTGDRVTDPDGIPWRIVSVAYLPGNSVARFILSRT